ncbi:MAG: peptidylprolyl isomerase [Bacteroidota bacterium]
MKQFLLFVLTCFTFFTSSAQKVVADKIIAIVGNKIILKSEIENTILDMTRQGVEVPENAKCLTLEQAMGVKALVLQAEKDSIPVSDEEVAADIDNQIRYFINAYGSKEELEKVSGKSVYQLKEDFKEGFRDRKLAAAMRNKIVDPIRITPNEVKIYFDALPKDSLAFYESELEIGQIVVYPKASRDAEEYAVSELKDYKAQIESGKKDFCKLAAIYSDDPGSKDKCGEYEVNRSEKQWDPVFLAKAFTLKEGQISAPFKTRFGYHIIQMVSRAGDDAVIRHILKTPQITAAEIRTVNQKLDSVRQQLVSGKLQFGEAVSKYSDDEGSKFTGGRKQNAEGSTYMTIDQLDKDMIPLIKNLTPGQYSPPAEFTDERGKRGVRIVYLISKTEPHRENIKDDYNRIAERALEEKKNDALDKWFSQKITGYFIKIDDEYKLCPEMAKWTEISENTAQKN